MAKSPAAWGAAITTGLGALVLTAQFAAPSAAAQETIDAALYTRDGMVSATMTSAPEKPVVRAVKMVALADPLPPLPQALARALEVKRIASDDAYPGCDGPAPMAIRLSPSATVWGVCAAMGAYNLDYAFYVVQNGKVRPARFERPARLANGEDRGDNVLTDPGISEDGLTLSSFYKGAGFGDCGSSGEWSWDGSRFRLVSYREMDLCRAVVPDDWPTLRADRP